MNSRSRILVLSLVLPALVGGVFLVDSPIAAQRAAENQTGSEAAPEEASVSDRPLEGYRLNLLDLAFEAASQMPIEPHIKVRSRVQESVVAASLELNQPHRALRFIEGIDNWRRGAGLADLAYYCAEQGSKQEAQQYLDSASKIALQPQEENEQEWRRDRIRAKIARTYLKLELPGKVRQFEAGLTDSEANLVIASKATHFKESQFELELLALGKLIEEGRFEQAQGGLGALAELFDRFYESQEKRDLIEARLRESWKMLPGQELIRLMMTLTDSALEHGDEPKALDLIRETQAVVDQFDWLPDDEIPLISQVAVLLHRAGEAEEAEADLKAGFELYLQKRDIMYDVFRPGALRPLAEAHAELGDHKRALMLYNLAIEEGVENPNSRPRAEELAASCLSMALHGVEPDAELWTRMIDIRTALNAPW